MSTPYLPSHRKALGLSQNRLARLAGVSRYNLCQFELGSHKLSEDDQRKLVNALRVEVSRLRQLPDGILPESTSGEVTSLEAISA